MDIYYILYTHTQSLNALRRGWEYLLKLSIRIEKEKGFKQIGMVVGARQTGFEYFRSFWPTWILTHNHI